MSLSSPFRSLSPRFFVVLSFLFVGMIALVGYELTAYRDGMTEERKIKSRTLVESVTSLIQFYDDKASKEGYSIDQAQKLAIQAIREINNNEKGYFWITDTKGRMLMHPIKPTLEGKDMSLITEPDGHILFFDFLKTIEQNGSGFAHYTWAKPDDLTGKSYIKITFVQNYKPWNWIIGSGIYLDDVNEAFTNGIYMAGAMSIAVLLFSIALALTASETLRKN